MIWKPPVKKTSFKSLKESGNMILAIFGAVALVGTIGAGTGLIVNGPMKVMSQVNRTAQTESQMMVASKMVMLDVANLTSSGDCDGDSLSEPREWRDAAGAGPDGVTDSDGGGFIPMAIGTSKRDSWGTQYGYCVWDHGAIIDGGSCIDISGQNRLQGFNSIDHPVIAVISAGPNGTFETPCRDFDNADNDSNDILDYGAGDDPLISPTGDDVVSVYSYAEAAEDNLGIWELAVDPTTNKALARTNKDVEFTGSSTSFGGTLTLDGTEGLDIPDDSSLITCDVTVEGQIRRNMSNDPPTLEVCEDTGGSVYAWSAMATSTPVTPSDIAAAIADPVFDPERGNCTKNKGGPFEEVGSLDTTGTAYKVWGDGTYIYVADGTNGIQAYTFDGSTFNEVGSSSGPNLAGNIWGDGTYIYVADRTDGVRAYTFDGSTFNEVAIFNTPGSAYDVWGDGTYIYVADLGGGLRAYTFDGSTFTELSSIATPDTTRDVWGDGKYIYIGDHNSGLRAYDFDGTTFTEVGSFATGAATIGVMGDGTYIYIADWNGGVRAYVFDGTTFTEEGFLTMANAHDVWTDGTHIYVTDGTNGVKSYTFTGSNFIENDIFNTPSIASGVWGDGTYIYVADSASGIRAYAGYTCTEAYVPDVKENYISQITVEQTGSTGDTLGTAGWSQVLASDDNGDETGISFVVDKNASKGSAPTAAITAIREADPGAAGMAFKTKASDGTINNRNYLGHSGFFGFDVIAGTTTNLHSTLQIGDHSTTWDADYQKGLLITGGNTLPAQIGYFGFWDDGTDTNVILFSKALKIKGSNVTGNSLREYIRFEQTQATTFFGNIEVKGEAQTASIQNKSYSNTDVNDGELNFKRKRLDSAGADDIVQDGDTVGQIKFQGFDGTSVYADGPTITAKVDGVPAANNIPTELTFKTKQTNFDPENANCGTNNGGPFTLTDTYDTSGNAYRSWSDGSYIYVGDQASGVHAFSFDGSNLTLLDTYDTTGNAYGIWGDDNYVYVGDDTSGVHAFTFNGTNFTLLDTYDTSGVAFDVWGDGTYVYVADRQSGVHALTFDGTSFTLIDTYDTNGLAYRIWSDGTYIYHSDGTAGINALAFDGTSFTLLDTYDTADIAFDVFGDGTYIYVADGSDGIHAFTFDGTSFTLLDTYDTTGQAVILWSDGTHVYVADNVTGTHALTFDGNSFTLIDTYDTPGNAFGVWGDGNSIFVTDNTNGIHAFSGFECNSEITVAANNNVGFQKSDPESKLHVGGRILADEGILIGNETTICNTINEGTLRYVSGQNEPVEICDGTNWIKIGAAVATPDPSLDCSPIPFELRNVTDGTASTEYTSNSFIVGGLDSGEECYLSLSTDASSAKINLNGADETSKIVTVENGDVIQVKATTGTGDECKTCHLSLGVQQASFQVGTGYGCKNSYPFDPENHNCTVNNGGPFALEGTFNTPSFARRIIGDGRYLYASDGTSGIRAYTFNGSTFTEVGSYNTPGDAYEVWLDGTYIYVADRASGVRAYTFDGSTFTEEGSYNTPGLAHNIWGDDTYIYVADHSSGIRAYTFNGSTFTEEGSYNTPGNAVDVWDDGTYIYVADDASGVRAYTFDGSTFTEEGSYNTSGNAWGVRGDGTYIYVTDHTGGLRAFTFDGTTFTEVGTHASQADGLWIDGTHIYVAHGATNIRSYTFDGSTFTQADSYNTTGNAQGVWGDGTYIYVADDTAGIHAFSGFECTYADPLPSPPPPPVPFDPEAANCTINNGGPFTLEGTDNTAGAVNDIWSDDTYIYVADGSNGIIAYSFDGTTFTEIDNYSTPDEAFEIWGDDTYIYVADGASGVRAYTFNGTAFTEEGSFNSSGSSQSVWSDGTYIYTANQGSGIYAYSFNGTTFTEIDNYNTVGSAKDVWGDGTYIYVADDNSGVRAYTFNGTAFTEEGNHSTSGRAYGVWGDGTYIYVADETGGVRAYTFNGTTFTEEGSYNTSGDAWGVWGDGTHVYVASNTGGVHAFTFDGSTFTLEDTFNTSGQAQGVWGDGTYIYVADYIDGIDAYSGFECTATGTPYDIEAANCTENQGGPFVEAGTRTLGGDLNAVWANGEFIYAGVGDGSAPSSLVAALSFNGSSFAIRGSDGLGASLGMRALGSWHDGTYLYSIESGSASSSYLYAHSHNGTTLTELDSISINSVDAKGVWGDGTYIYTVHDPDFGATTNLRAYTFDGTTLTYTGHTLGGAGTATGGIWSDGTYIYATSTSHLHAFSYNGTAFTLEGSVAVSNTAFDVWGDGTYIYAALSNDGIKAYTFDGSTFTEEGSENTVGQAKGIWGDGKSIYVADHTNGIVAYSFNGSTFTEEDTFDTPGSATDVWGDGNFVYVADGTSDTIRAYSGFKCTSTD